MADFTNKNCDLTQESPRQSGHQLKPKTQWDAARQRFIFVQKFDLLFGSPAKGFLNRTTPATAHAQ
jgi:hypothetical protein